MSYEFFESRRERGSPLGCAWAFLVTGLVLILVGWLWHYPKVTSARGVIVESQRLNPPNVYRINYEYEAFGSHYPGTRVMRLSSQFQPFYTVGSVFPVYFVTEHPEQSYGPNRPIVQPLIVTGILTAALGGVIIYFAWR